MAIIDHNCYRLCELFVIIGMNKMFKDHQEDNRCGEIVFIFRKHN